MDCIQYVDAFEGNGIEPGEYSIDSNARIDSDTQCCECGRTIIKGVKHTFERGEWGGVPMEFRTCGDCISVRMSFFVATGWTFGRTWADLGEHIYRVKGEVGEVHISCLSEWARENVCDCIESAQCDCVTWHHVIGNHPVFAYQDSYHIIFPMANKERIKLMDFGYEVKIEEKKQER
jgi:hypothetical protein